MKEIKIFQVEMQCNQSSISRILETALKNAIYKLELYIDYTDYNRKCKSTLHTDTDAITAWRVTRHSATTRAVKPDALSEQVPRE